MRGIDAMRADLEENLKELVPCRQSQQEYTVVQNCGRALSIIGRYIVTTDAGASVFARVQQRMQIIWELIDGELRIRSLYISHPETSCPSRPGSPSATLSVALPSATSMTALPIRPTSIAWRFTTARARCTLWHPWMSLSSRRWASAPA